MSADSFLAYCGLRFVVAASEIEDVERRTDARILRARKSALQFYYGSFGGDRNDYLLFIGYPVGVFGVENSLKASFSITDMQDIFQRTRSKLIEAGFEGNPAFHFQLEPDF